MPRLTPSFPTRRYSYLARRARRPGDALCDGGLSRAAARTLAAGLRGRNRAGGRRRAIPGPGLRSEEHTPELQSLMRRSYAAVSLIKNKESNIASTRPTYHYDNIQSIKR